LLNRYVAQRVREAANGRTALLLVYDGILERVARNGSDARINSSQELGGQTGSAHPVPRCCFGEFRLEFGANHQPTAHPPKRTRARPATGPVRGSVTPPRQTVPDPPGYCPRGPAPAECARQAAAGASRSTGALAESRRRQPSERAGPQRGPPSRRRARGPEPWDRKEPAWDKSPKEGNRQYAYWGKSTRREREGDAVTVANFRLNMARLVLR
jgi:hypothetical protein